MATTVLLVEDDGMMRTALRMFLGREEGIDVVAEAEGGLHAVDLAAEVHPDVVVMDIGLPDLDGLEAMRRILAGRPSTGAVVLSGSADRQIVQAARAAGATAVVPKERAFEELVPAVRAAAARAR